MPSTSYASTAKSCRGGRSGCPVSGPTGDPSHDNPSWEEPRRIVEKAEALGVREHVIFGGRVPTDPHGPGQRTIVENTPLEYRDRRDWDETRAWASRIAAELGGAVPNT